jgi:hypothetical protein
MTGADTEWHPVGICCLHLVAVHDDHCLEPDLRLHHFA